MTGTETRTHRWGYDFNAGDWWCFTCQSVTDYCAEQSGSVFVDATCPECGALDPMGDEAAWHADGCPHSI